MKKLIGPILAGLLVVGIGVASFVSAGRKTDEDRKTDAAANVVEIRGLSGSEKDGFFSDPRVKDVLLKNGLSVKIDKLGSREIATRDLKNYDFGFPAGVPAATLLKNKVKATQTYPAFFTPMAVASWKSLTPVFEKEGVAKQINGTWYISDMKKLVSMIDSGTRWRDLKSNNVYNTGKSILISSTDIRTSNSAAMYLSLVSYIMNDNNVVDDAASSDRIAQRTASLFSRQGLQEASSAGPFEDYTIMGIGKAPLVMIYESQFLEYQSKRDKPNQDMVLLYPQPTLFTKHIVVPFNDKGRKFGEVMTTDPEIRKLAAEYGFRTSDESHFNSFMKSKGLSVPSPLVDVIDPPNYEHLERMISVIEKKISN